MLSAEDCICVGDFKALAEQTIPRNSLVFVNSGATNEQTLEENCTAFKRWRFRPRVLRNVSKIDTSITILGQNMSFPVGVAPTGLMKLFSEGGEKDAAIAAAISGSIFTQSMWASSSIEEIASSKPNGIRWFQLYILQDRDLTISMVRRAENNGFKAIVLTIDCPAVGKRYKILKDFKLPAEVAPKNFETHAKHGYPITWDDVDWLKSQTSLPVIIKGILTPEGVEEAIKRGAAAIWVSNHGGRQLDGVLPTITALPPVSRAVNGRCPILFDGGIRNGGDLAKAIVLGADAVFLGRPIIWGVATGGVTGVQKVLEILKDELQLTMKLLGVTSIKELKEGNDLVVHESEMCAKI